MLNLTNLTVYRFFFGAALLISEGLYAYRLPKRSGFRYRLLTGILLSFLLYIVFPIPVYNAWYTSFMFGCFFLYSIPMLFFCFETEPDIALFCGIAGYSTQHFASVLYDLLTTLTGYSHSAEIYSSAAFSLNLFDVLLFLEVYVTVYWLFYELFARRIRRGETVTLQSIPLLLLVTLIMMVEILLHAVLIYHKYERLDLLYYLPGILMNLICTCTVLVIQFNLLLSQSLKDELQIVSQMWHQDQKQYALAQETIDLINIKCHDMRHQIHDLTSKASLQPEAVREMESAITIYDSMLQTGCRALNVILAEKSLLCQKYGITISCIADGEKLNFMQEADIYSLFGNMIDNAVTAVTPLEKDKRVISILIRHQDAFLSVHSNNYYAGEIQIRRGIPVTTKEDTNYHGFGTRSMRMVVEKYGGTISFHTNDHVFHINILFRLPGGGASNDEK